MGRLLTAIGTMLLAACADSEASEPFTVGAAASLRDLLEATTDDFVAASPGSRPSFAFAASSTIARQIAAGAPIDVFVSADGALLEQAGPRVRPDEARRVFGNRLALVGRSTAPKVDKPEELLRVGGSIAVAATSVPAGKAAREELRRLGLFESLSERLVSADHVRAALSLVESGQADYGFVYVTDARAAKRSVTLWEADLGPASRISYLGVGVNDTNRGERVRAYLDFFASSPFRERARSLGFQVEP